MAWNLEWVPPPALTLLLEDLTDETRFLDMTTTPTEIITIFSFYLSGDHRPCYSGGLQYTNDRTPAFMNISLSLPPNHRLGH